MNKIKLFRAGISLFSLCAISVATPTVLTTNLNDYRAYERFDIPPLVNSVGEYGHYYEAYKGFEWFVEGVSKTYSFDFQNTNLAPEQGLKLASDVIDFQPGKNLVMDGILEVAIYDIDGWNPFDLENIEFDITMLIDNTNGTTVEYGLSELDGWVDIHEGVMLFRHQFNEDELISFNQEGVSNLRILCSQTDWSNRNDFALKGVALSTTVPEPSMLLMFGTGILCMFLSGKKRRN